MLGSLAVPALAAGDDFVIEDGVLTRYKGPGGDVVIPDGVTKIGDRAFQKCTGLTSVIIPDSVTSIGYDPFLYCSNLRDITIPASVTSINEGGYATGFTGFEEWQPGCDFYVCAATLHISAGSYIEQRILGRPWGSEYWYDIPYVTDLPALTASPSTQTVMVDGKSVEFEMYALEGGAVNYIRLRDLAAILSGTPARFDVKWDGKGVTLAGGEPYTGSGETAPFHTDMPYNYLVEPLHWTGGRGPWSNSSGVRAAIRIMYNGGGYTYYKLRDIGEFLGFNVGWDAGRGIYVETGKPYDPAN